VAPNAVRVGGEQKRRLGGKKEGSQNFCVTLGVKQGAQFKSKKEKDSNRNRGGGGGL